MTFTTQVVSLKEFTDMLAKFVKEMNTITKQVQDGAYVITHTGSRARTFQQTKQTKIPTESTSKLIVVPKQTKIPTDEAFLTKNTSGAWQSHGDQAKISHSIRLMRMGGS